MRTERSLVTRCWACQEEPGAGLFCQRCEQLQPVPDGADHFTLLGLPRKLTINPRQLEETFYALSRRLHPDRFTIKSVREQELSLALSAAVNTAYETLTDPIQRARYLLGLEGLSVDEERGNVPPDLMEDIFAIQEDLEAYRAGDQGLRSQVEEARGRVQEAMGVHDARLQDLATKWDATVARHVLETIRETLAHRAYLRTTLRDIGRTLGEE